jgi:integrase
MPTASLTDRKIDSLKPGKQLNQWFDKKVVGFGIRISQEGTKTWFVQYRFAGVRHRLKLGRYPDVHLAVARKRAQEALLLVSDGVDPAQKRKAEEESLKRERLATKTFAQLSRQFLDEYAKLNKRSWDEDERIIDKVLIPEFGTLNAKEIVRGHIRDFLRAYGLKAPVQANRIHACIRKIFNWAIKEEIADLESNPAANITRPGGKEQPKDRALSDAELKAVWNELENQTTHVREVLRLVLLTGQRPGEVMAMEWSELDLPKSLWTIPGTKTKNRLSNVVPLSPQALRVLERHRKNYENRLEKRRKRGDQSKASRFVFPNKRLIKEGEEPITHVRKATNRIWRTLQIKPFSAHDLRRTCATKLGQMEVPGHVIARILNHKQTDVTSSVYNQYQYLKEKREALDGFGAWIARLASGLELVGDASVDHELFHS